MKYLLDANAISHIVRFPTGKVAERLTEVGSEMVFTSIIVSAEVMYGVRKKGSDDLTKKVVAVLSKLTTAPFIQPADETYGEVRSQLEKSGTPIGPNDLFIAAHAIALDATLVTDNVREFSRVPGMKIENWLR